jgi:Nif-specific regulatory protein/two-component system response regulator HydG
MLRHLLEIGKRMLAESETDRALTVALDGIIEASGATRGMITIFEEGGEFLLRIARNADRENLDQPEFENSRRVIDEVRTTGHSVCLANAPDDTPLRSCSRPQEPKFFSVISIPLHHLTEVFGVVYLDNLAVSGAFTPETIHLVESFADFILLSAQRAVERQRSHNRIHALETDLRTRYQFESIVGHDAKMVAVLKLIAQIADADATVLVQGESGTGKELVARALHYNSSRKDKSFVPINCGALPENLLESELFGHARGAFTGAIRDKTGWFECSTGGTIFLDEVNEMTPALQVKLLRVLETGEYSRVGDTQIRRCDVRVVAAASMDLQKLVKAGEFRKELYYRLNVIEIVLPPLRERKGDLQFLIQHFMKYFAGKYHKGNLRLSPDAEATLWAYDFPGNVRELEHIIHRAALLAEDELIEPRYFPATVHGPGVAAISKDRLSTFKIAKRQAIEKFEREYLVDCLRAAKGNISHAAQMAGIDFKNFHIKMTNYGIDAHAFKTMKE